ncbi:glycosyltransferase family 2 protein [Paenibacillus koleovorans]|uniref:glycosyltransferase family 2 protein n=1 Tax=Paenibacillus koleovorans TaxID=121608 RepID=UPI000FD968FE|nr:glycosyltransferase family 2 protein [Paenibacillus koleovorans]
MQGKGKGSIGVHMIVRNEEAALPRCLATVRDWVGEMVVVDTGSTDRTREMALSNGAIVLEVPWADDFAAARNVGLAQATTDWVLVIDADEEAVAGMDQLAETLAQASDIEECADVTLHSWFGNGPEEKLEHTAVRLFRNGRGYRYTGKIHEQLEREEVDGVRKVVPASFHSPVVLRHTGYLPSELQRKQTAERNMRLLQLALAEQPDDPFHHYNLGVAWCQAGALREALASFERAWVSAPERAPYRAALIRDKAKVLLALDRPAEARKLLHAEVERYEGYSDLLMLLGECCERLRMPADAIRAYRAAVREAGPGGLRPPFIREAGMDGWRPLTALGRLHQRAGDLAQADACYRRALEQQPLHEPALAGWADLLQLAGADDAAIRERLLQAVRPASEAGPDGEAAARERVARALAACGAHAAALEVLPPGGGGEGFVCSGLLQTGQFARAAERLAAWCTRGCVAGAAAAGAEGIARAVGSTGADGSAGAGGIARAVGETGSAGSDGSAGMSESARTAGQLPVAPAGAVADWALCTWRLGRALPPAFYSCTGLSAEQARAYEVLERLLLRVTVDASGEVTTARLDGAEAVLELAADRLHRAVELRELELAHRLSRLHDRLPLVLAKSLYCQGFVLAAADRLLTLMGEGRLDGEGLFYVAETVYEKHYYMQAASLFEQAVALDPGLERASVGAAMSYLKLAHEVASEHAEADADGLRADMEKLERSMAVLDAVGWRTVYNGSQRRNKAYAAGTDFAVHDRQG